MLRGYYMVVFISKRPLVTFVSVYQARASVTARGVAEGITLHYKYLTWPK